MFRSVFVLGRKGPLTRVWLASRWDKKITTSISRPNAVDSPKGKQDKPIKFTTSEAHVAYKATRNFYGDDRDLPPSHNYVLTGTGILGFFYLIFLRDDIENDGGVNLFVPIHEQIPQFAIPMLEAAIVENRKLGYNTQKLEKKLAEYMEEPEKYGGGSKKLVEN